MRVTGRDLALIRLFNEIHLEQLCWSARGALRMLKRPDGANPWFEAQPLVRKHLATFMRRMGIEALCPERDKSRKSRGRGPTASHEP